MINKLNEAAKIAEKVGDAAQKAAPVIQTIISSLETIFETLGKSWDKISQVAPSANVNKVQKDFLNKEGLVTIAKENRVPDANEVCVMKKDDEDGKGYIVYIAYAKDRELLPMEQNKYVIIMCEGLSRDLLSLFSDKQLIILK